MTRPGGTVAACVWDHAGGRGPLSPLWDAARELDSGVEGESLLAGARHGHLAELFEAAGLHEIDAGVLEVEVQHPSFDEWWEPFTLGVGPAGGYVVGLDPADARAVERAVSESDSRRRRSRCAAYAWAARALA